MKKKLIMFSSIGAVLVAAIIIVLCLCLPKGKAYRSIKVFSVTGTVNVIRKDNTLSATKDMKLKNEDRVEVKEASNTVLKLDNDKFIMVKENTNIDLVATGKKNNTKTKVLIEKGGVVVEVKEKLKDSETFEVATSNTVMAIRGTLLEMSKDEITGNTFVLMAAGVSRITFNPGNRPISFPLETGEKVTVKTDGTTPSDMLELSNSDKVEVITKVERDELDEDDVTVGVVEADEIDDIIQNANEFDRENKNDKLNDTIKYSIDGNAVYGTNPNTIITVEENYKDIEGLRYLYSKSENGEFAEFDLNNPLDAGSYYIKLEAGNAYTSLVKEIVIDKLEIKINALSADMNYGDNPKDLITFKNAPENYTIKYSNSLDGEYIEFDINNPLEVGKWYFTVDAGSNYTFTNNYFTVTAKDINLNYNLSQIAGKYGQPSNVLLSINDDEFFTSEEALEVNEYGMLKYYVTATDGMNTYYLDAENREVVFRPVALEDNYQVSLTFDYNIPAHYNFKNVTQNPVVKQLEYGIKVSNVRVSFIPNLDGAYDGYGFDFSAEVCIDPTMQDTIPGDYGLILLEMGEFEGEYRCEPIPVNSYSEDTYFVNISGAVTNGTESYYAIPFIDDRYFEFALACGCPEGEDGYDVEDYIYHSEVFRVDTQIFENTDDRAQFLQKGEDGFPYFITYNDDNTYNLYLDLQADSETCDNSLNYLIIFNDDIYDGSLSLHPDKYLYGKGRYALIENINSARIAIKAVYAIYEMEDGSDIAYAYSDYIDFDGYQQLISIRQIVNYPETMPYGNISIYDMSLLDNSTIKLYDDSYNLLGELSKGTDDFTDGVGSIQAVESEYFIIDATINTTITKECLEFLTDYDTEGFLQYFTSETFETFKAAFKEFTGTDVKGNYTGRLVYRSYNKFI